MLHGKICVRKSLGLPGAWNCLLLATLVLPPVLVGRIRLMNPKNPGLQSWGRERISGVSKGEECLALLQYNLTPIFPRGSGFGVREVLSEVMWIYVQVWVWVQHFGLGVLSPGAPVVGAWRFRCFGDCSFWGLFVGNFCIYGWVVGCFSFSRGIPGEQGVILCTGAIQNCWKLRASCDRRRKLRIWKEVHIWG